MTWVATPDQIAAEIAEQRQNDRALVDRVRALEAAIREMHAAVPGGTHTDPQKIGDALREIACRVGVDIPD